MPRRKAKHNPREEPVAFDLAGALAGARRGVPVAVGVFAVGLVFGALARTAGLSAAEATLMSLLVLAGASQFVALDLWTSPLPVAAILLTTLVVNLRHVLMGAALAPLLLRVRPRAAYAAVFFMVDESWAMTMDEYVRGRRNGAFLLGCGLVLSVAWVGATLAGHVAGEAVGDPSRWGLDFAITAVFAALLASLWRGRSDLMPWVVAAAVAVAADHALPGNWYILLGGLAGSLAGAVQRGATRGAA